MPTWHLAKTQKMVGSSIIVIMRLMIIIWASLMAQMVKKKKSLPAMKITGVQSLSQEDPLEKGMASHYSILAWRILMDRGAWPAAVHGVAKNRT